MKTRILVFAILSLTATYHCADAQTISARSNPVRVAYSTLPDVGPPTIAWITPDESVTQTEEPSLKVKVGVATPHPALTIKTISLLVNGRNVSVYAENSTDSQFEKTIEKNIELSGGPNEIKIIAENMRGEKATASRFINVTLPAVETITYEDLGITELPKYYALIIGVSDYTYSTPNDLPDLAKPVQDAKALYNVLLAKYSFTKETTTLLENPTQSDIVGKLYEMAATITEKDNVFIFYAGHGSYDQANEFGWWLAADAKPKTPGTWIETDRVRDYLAKIKSKHTLLITDACFGGSIFKETRSVSNAVLSNKIAQFRQFYTPKSRRAITSGNLTVVADESVFIKFLIAKLEQNEELFLPSQILFSQMLEPISNSSRTLPKQGVIAFAGDEGGDFVFMKKK